MRRRAAGQTRRRDAAARPSRSSPLDSLALGLVYSADAPLLRWKRSPVLAAACIFGVRAVAVQFGFYLHMAASVLHRCARGACGAYVVVCVPAR